MFFCHQTDPHPSIAPRRSATSVLDGKGNFIDDLNDYMTARPDPLFGLTILAIPLECADLSALWKAA